MREHFISLNREISIDLDTGVYVFDDESSTGKTFLSKCLKEYSLNDTSIDSYTYQDLKKGVTLPKYIGNRRVRYLMLDRYDLYVGIFTEYIRELSKNCTIMIDCKGDMDISYLDCGIEFTKGKIEVFDRECNTASIGE